jgi:hypothetical protein
MIHIVHSLDDLEAMQLASRPLRGTAFGGDSDGSSRQFQRLKQKPVLIRRQSSKFDVKVGK